MVLWRFPEMRYRITHELYATYFYEPPPSRNYERLGENAEIIQCTQDVYHYDPMVVDAGKLEVYGSDKFYDIPNQLFDSRTLS